MTQAPFSFARTTIAELERSISPARFSTYLRAAGGDRQRALRLYGWNASVAHHFMLPLQACEISLRNAISRGLARRFNGDWARDHGFRSMIRQETSQVLQAAITRVVQRMQPRYPALDDIVAELTLGFWAQLLTTRYRNLVWRSELKESFPHLPVGYDVTSVHNRVDSIRSIRNRIAHHEPIFERNLQAEYAGMMGFLGWVCPDTRWWVELRTELPPLLKLKP